MPSRIASLPPGERSVSYFRGYARHRCDLLATGIIERRPRDGYDFDNSSRDEAALVFQYTISGSGEFRDKASGQTVKVVKGTSFLVPLPSETRYRVFDDTWRFLYLYFGGDLAKYLVKDLVSRSGYLYQTPEGSPVLAHARELHTSCMKFPQPDEDFISEHLYGLLLDLRRSARIEGRQAMAPEIARALEYLSEHAGEASLSVEQVAEAVGYSKYHFSRLFKRHTGETPHAHLVRLRIQRSLELITGTTRPVKSIAREVGFRDYPYFCNAFRKHTGLTPGTARARLPAPARSE